MSYNHPMPNVEGLWIPKPENQHTLIANPGGDAARLMDEQTNPDGLLDKPKCAYKSCEKYPQTVCTECVEYICEDHIFRHPNCEAGK